MTEPASTSETINFFYPYPDAPPTESTSFSANIYLDEPRNFSLYGVKDKSTFIYGEVAYVVSEITETISYGETPTQAAYVVTDITTELHSIYYTGDVSLDSGTEVLKISISWDNITWEKSSDTSQTTGKVIYGWRQVREPQSADFSFSVSYKKPDKYIPPPPPQIDYTFSIELDQSAIKAAYKNEKSDFYYTETAYLKVLPSKTDVAYSLLTGPNGLTSFTHTGNENYIEEVTFTNTDTATLKYIPQGNVNSVWVVGNAGVTVSGKNITLSKKTIGILQCSYSITVDYYNLVYKGSTSLKETTVGVVSDYSAIIPTGNNSASIIVSFSAKDYVTPPPTPPTPPTPPPPIYSSSDVSLELDTEYIMSYYGVDKTEFDFKETAFLKLIPSQSNCAYSLLSSNSVVSLATANCLYDVDEDIAFTNENEATLKYFPQGVVTTVWKSQKSFPVVVTGKTVTVQNPLLTVGILNCKYKTQYDRLQVVYQASSSAVPTDAVTAIVIADYSASILDTSVDCSVVFSDLAAIGYNDVELIIKDIGSDLPVVGATVTITLQGVGTSYVATTNASGSVIFPKLTVGDVYDVVITHPNYISSTGDYLNNDSFTVPAS